MKSIVTCEEMRALDHRTIEVVGIPSCVLMERAALAVVEEIQPRITRADRILVVCGSGNNGGDGYAIARLLHHNGYAAETFFAGNESHFSTECLRQKQIALASNVPETYRPIYEQYTVFVDALFGIGLSRTIEGSYAEIIQKMNRPKSFRVSVDIPSGIHGDTGAVLGTAFQADLTVTFGFRKAGMCFYPGRAFCGELIVKDIGIYDPTGTAALFASEPQDLRTLPARNPAGNKGTFGKVLLLAGSDGMCGAAYLSASAALHTGCGMIEIHTPESNRMPLQTLLPEAILCTDFSDESFERLFHWCDVLVCGPGLSQSSEALERLTRYLELAKDSPKPFILDADALNLLAASKALRKLLGSHVICTPHMGELSRLTNTPVSKLKTDPIRYTKNLAAETGAVIISKDSCTVIAAGGEGSVYLNLFGNDGMATAGSGDVLSGVIAGIACMFLSEHCAPIHAAALGVLLHAAAGDLAAAIYGRHGLTARNLVEQIPQVLKKLEDDAEK